MIDIFKRNLTLAFAIVTGIFTFVPESFFSKIEWIKDKNPVKCLWMDYLETKEVNVIISRIMCFLLILAVTSLIHMIYLVSRRHIIIKGMNYTISVEYGDILKMSNGKRVINFDECFTTHIGNLISDINPSSICGQYLKLNPNLDIQQLLNVAHIMPARSKSRYQHQIRYESGTLVPNGEDLLMAFAKLDEKGKGRFFSRDEYLSCLELLWKEIENYYSEKDVYIPVLGAGTTSFDGGDGASISQQDLLDIMIWSYKLNSHKVKKPHKLHIVCKKNKDFSINRIGK